MTGEEISGPPGPKVLRMLYFVGAGIICTAAINKWVELERKWSEEKKQQDSDILTDSAATVVQKAVK